MVERVVKGSAGPTKVGKLIVIYVRRERSKSVIAT